jgi:hypothetical protein
MISREIMFSVQAIQGKSVISWIIRLASDAAACQTFLSS